jgi:hypothetical protein
MHAIVVYESHWGNTATVAQAIADGLGPDARALTTAEAVGPALADADLIVAGAPVIAFSLPSERMLAGLPDNPNAPRPPDMSAPSMRSWLAGLPGGHGRSAAFETRIRWSPGGATSAIDRELRRAGYTPIAKPAKFVVSGQFGPLREGETDRARRWGAELAREMS